MYQKEEIPFPDLLFLVVARSPQTINLFFARSHKSFI